MATLKNLQNNEHVTLFVQHVFGRHPHTNNTCLKSPDISRTHAVISWNNDTWSIKDTSTNGTFVNGRRIDNRGTQLLQHDRIQFGNLQADYWELIDNHAPQSMLLPVSPGLEPVLLSGLVGLPSEQQPDITLYASADGQWMCESSAGTYPLKSGDLVGTEEKTWRFVDSKPSSETEVIAADHLPADEKIGLDFSVSQNEEHVSLTVLLNNQAFNLSQRSHHYLLLLLARKRLEDQQGNVSDQERGWLLKEQLATMLGMSESHINIQIYRFRKQLNSVLSESGFIQQCIERRSGELRLACDNITITGGLNA